jgi:hypothetical protein
MSSSSPVGNTPPDFKFNIVNQGSNGSGWGLIIASILVVAIGILIYKFIF